MENIESVKKILGSLEEDQKQFILDIIDKSRLKNKSYISGGGTNPETNKEYSENIKVSLEIGDFKLNIS